MRPSRPALFATVLLIVARPAPAQRGDAPDAPLRSPAESRALFHLPPGFEIQLVAAEPDIQKPLNLAFDAAGRVWVTGSTLYPWPARRDARDELIPTFEKNWDANQLAFRAAATPPDPAEHGLDSVRILSDFGPDGRARKTTVFADGLNIPVGILPLPRAPGDKDDAALVFSIPAIWRLTDTDGDGRADVREKLYDGFGFRDTHGMSSNYWLWLDGWVYGTHGFANVSEVRDRAGRTVTVQSGNTYRFRPDGSHFEVFAHGQSNPFGLAFDARGDVFTADSHSKPVYLLVPDGYYEGIGKEHDGLGFAPSITLDDHGSSAIAGIAHYSATQFPPEFRGNLFNGNPVTRRINRARLDWRGSSPTAVRQPDFLTSDDPAFRPVQVKLGPDGALWIADFYNPIIGHYEVPLTHPGRDHGHGRVWRIVWRGLDGNAPVSPPPNLSRLKTADLVARLADANLVVRSLATAEFLARPDAVAATPALHAAAARLVAGTDPAADELAALPFFFALERLDRSDDELLRRALSRRESGVAVAALRVLAARASLAADTATVFKDFLAPPAPELGARLAADVFRQHPQPWQPALLLTTLARAPAQDFELIYALRLALKTHALNADVATLRDWAAAGTAVAGQLAEVCLAVPTPAAAEFLLGHLERGEFAGPRAGDFARHAVAQLPPDRFAAVLPLLRSLATAPLAQRIALAEGLARVAAQPDRTLPGEVDVWMRRELIAAIGGADLGPAFRAINALKPLALAEKAGPLRRIALTSSYNEGTRTAAVRALTSDAEGTEQTLIDVLGSDAPQGLRRVAAELLGTADAGPAARAALAAAVGTASADLVLVLATGLAKSDAGAAELLDLTAAGRVRPTLLRHRYLVLAFEKRPSELRARADELTRNLPPEDARLDAVIAQRLGAASRYRVDAARGAMLFGTHCAACHRFRNQGGNIGPSLDGIGSRTTPRLVEDILDPGRNVDPVFRLANVTLKNGDIKSGMNPRQQGGQLLLTDPAGGAVQTFRSSDVKEVQTSLLSPMPAAFESLLNEQELFDLLAYLRSSTN